MKCILTVCLFLMAGIIDEDEEEALFIVTFLFNKAVVGGTAGPAMAGPLFWPKIVLAGPLFRPNMICFSFFRLNF